MKVEAADSARREGISLSIELLRAHALPRNRRGHRLTQGTLLAPRIHPPTNEVRRLVGFVSGVGRHVRGSGVHGQEFAFLQVRRRGASQLHPDLATDHPGGLGAAGGSALVGKADRNLKPLRGVGRQDGPARGHANRGRDRVGDRDPHRSALRVGDRRARLKALDQGPDLGDIGIPRGVFRGLCGGRGGGSRDVGRIVGDPLPLRSVERGHIPRHQPQVDQIGIDVGVEIGLPGVEVGVGLGNVVRNKFSLWFQDGWESYSASEAGFLYSLAAFDPS
jgi:hypothetical protein